MTRYLTRRVGWLVLLALGCTDKPVAGKADQPVPSGVRNRVWTVVALQSDSAPIGAGELPLTLRFDSASSRVAGFSGCNRFSARYNLTAESLTIGPALVTRMACPGADSLEDQFLAALTGITGYEVRDSLLLLTGPDGVTLQLRHR